MRLNNKVYDVLKWVALIAVPFVDLLSAILPVWGCPTNVATSLVTTVSALGLFCGAVIGLSSAQYYRDSVKDEGEVKG